MKSFTGIVSGRPRFGMILLVALLGTTLSSCGDSIQPRKGSGIRLTVVPAQLDDPRTYTISSLRTRVLDAEDRVLATTDQTLNDPEGEIVLDVVVPEGAERRILVEPVGTVALSGEASSEFGVVLQGMSVPFTMLAEETVELQISLESFVPAGLRVRNTEIAEELAWDPLMPISGAPLTYTVEVRETVGGVPRSRLVTGLEASSVALSSLRQEGATLTGARVRAENPFAVGPFSPPLPIDETPDPRVLAVSVTPVEATVMVGLSREFEAEVTVETGADPTLTWTSNPAGALLIEELGSTGANRFAVRVTGVEPGVVQLIACSQLNANVCDPTPVTVLPAGEIAYSRFDGQGRADIFRVTTDGIGPTNLTQTPTESELRPAWRWDGDAMAYERETEITGGAFTTNSDIQYEDVGLDGTLSNTILWRSTRDVLEQWPAYSPDGRFFAFVEFRVEGQAAVSDIIVQDLNLTQPPLNLTNAAGNDFDPEWSPDGTKIIFTSDRLNAPSLDIFITDASGTGPQTPLTDDGFSNGAATFSPDGSRILFSSNRGNDGRFRLYTMNADGTGITLLPTSGSLDVFDPDWSPDGSAIVFLKGSATSLEVTVMNVDGTGEVALPGASGQVLAPSWRPRP